MQEIKAERTISAQAADRLIAAHDGDVALLYLYILQHGGYDEEQAAAALCRTLRQIREAEEKLRRMALLPSSGAPQPAQDRPQPPLPPAEELPQYTAEEISRRAREDRAFSVILDEAARVIGRNLSGHEIRMLFGVYDDLSLPAEVVMMLLHYCEEQFSERWGSSRRPSARAIEKLAYEWAREEILTLEQAEAYIAAQKERRSTVARVKRLLNIFDRELSATEQKYIASWLDMGFGEDAIELAYDRTITQTNALKWPYMNKILLSWHEKGLHTVKEIEEKDGRRPPQKPASRGDVKPVDMDALRKIIDKI